MRVCVLFTALLWRHIEKKWFLSFLPPSFCLPSLSSLHSPIPLTYCWVFSMWVVFAFHALHSLSLRLCVSPSIIISASAVPYCWEAIVTIIFLLYSSLFLPLSLSLWLPLFHYPPLTTVLCCCEVDPTFRTPILSDCALLSLHLSFLFSSFWPSLPGYRDVPLWKETISQQFH